MGVEGEPPSPAKAGFGAPMGRRACAGRIPISFSFSFFIATVLAHFTYAEKLTVMFSAPRRKEGIFAKPASQQAQGQELENCETVSYFTTNGHQ
jgi:hypothetical protein